MGLICLLLTADAALLDVVRNTFGAAGVGLELRPDAASAIELAGRRHIDGFVIDCDDVRGAMDTLATIRNSRSNKLSVVFAVLNGKTTVSAAIEAGANFVAGKPVLDTLLRSHLDIALPRMEREHRRYFRHKVDLPITLTSSNETVVGKIINVSEGGLAVTHFGPVAVEDTLTIQFGLPGTSAQVFRAKAELVWRDAFAIGLRFLRIEPDCRLSFEAWLESLEAQLQFRESIQLNNAPPGLGGRL
ncbi:MAG: PilZ domain-containing protein [Terriglobales bacterium]